MAAKPVVVGVDGSEGALRAVEWAALEAERRKASLRILSAPAMPSRMHGDHGPAQTVATELRGFAERALEEAVTRAEEIAPSLSIDTGLLTGAPAEAIAGSGSGALMVVVGARGIGGFAALVLGSVSRYVASRAACPVVVVRAGAAAVHREIAVGVRDPREATEALAFGFEEAALRGAGLAAVYASHTAGHPDGDEREALAETLGEWRDKYPAVAARPEIISGHPGQVLAEYSGRADLLVVGRHGTPAADHAGLGHAIGSVPHTVLSHARGPVAVIPCVD